VTIVLTEAAAERVADHVAVSPVAHGADDTISSVQRSSP
jgi:hypothetical protein